MDPSLTIDDDWPIFRPRMGGGRREAPRSGARSLRNAVFAAARGVVRRTRARSSARARLAMLRPASNARRVVIKAHVQRMNASGAKAAALHLRYIVRDGVERDGAKGVLYGEDGPARAVVFEQPRPGEAHQFRLIVSPEDGTDLDLTDYVRRLMGTVERDLGRKIEWAAVNHYNTEHPHAHVVVRGVDRDGQELRLDRAYISKGLRWRAQELATEELGPRPELDVRRARAKEITQERFTSLDLEIERRAQENRVEVRARNAPARPAESEVALRLEHLEGLRLAERVSPASWKLREGWQQRLHELGSRGDILQQIHDAISGDPARYHVLRRGSALEADAPGRPVVVSGRVARKGLSDELKGGFYAVIETPAGHAYHVQLDARSAAELRPGDVVSFTTKRESPVRPVDREIAEMARAQGGSVGPAEGVDAGAHPVGRRLRELECLGLASSAGTNRWTVSPDLVRELEERHRGDRVRHRVVLRKEALSVEAQVRHPGPVWLDRVRADSLAPHGFGAEVKRAVERRRDALRELGVELDQSNRFAALRELERRAVGKEIAARSGQVFEASLPDGLRGRVEIHAAHTGASYAVISDGSRLSSAA
jgi:type IV secretory pathway VirD2 relaxase